MTMNRRRFLELGSAAFVLPAALAGRSHPDGDDALYWPSDHALPTFREPQHLDFANIQNLTGDQQVLLTTLQGVVNRRQPRLYFSLQNDNTDQTWLTTFQIPFTTAADPLALIERYRHEVSGAIIYDPNVPDTINVATSLAGLHNAVIATADLAAQYQIPVKQDLRGV